MSLGKVPGKMFEPQAQEPSMQGKHDNPAHERQPQGIVTPKKVQNDAYLILTTEREGGQGVRSPSTVGTGQAHESRG